MDRAIAESEEIMADLGKVRVTATSPPQHKEQYMRMMFLSVEAECSHQTLDAICQRRRLACIPVLAHQLLRRDRTSRAVVQAIDRLGPAAVDLLRETDRVACELFLDELGRIREEEEASFRELDDMLRELESKTE
jgi:hypothetical protein